MTTPGRTAAGEFPRIGGGRLSDRVAADLEDRILNGRPGPGERLPTEAELCELFAVSRSVVRDALRTLRAKGLVSVGPREGIVVLAPSDEPFGQALLLLLARSGLTMRQVTEARAAIETNIGPLAAERGTAADWAQMQEDLDRFGTAVDQGRWRAAHDSHLAFHLGLLRAVHLPALEILLKPMHEVIVLSSVPPAADNPELWDVATHPPILAALRSGKPQRVRQALEAHFHGFLDDARYAQFESQPFRDAGMEAMRYLNDSAR
jgi:DNA-binding FadR family transcriptional regulator